jgi:outer membrane receptor protein involved in Fe transport
MKITQLMGATALAGSLALAFPALAQTTSPTTGAGDVVNPGQADADSAVARNAGSVQSVEDDGEANTVVVTGTRIARPNDVSPIPVSTVTAGELAVTARTSVGDVLNDLPQLRSTYSQSNSTRFLGTAGLSLLDLRGLGTQRTLVLVNGRRHVGADVLNNAVSVDVNTIPTDLIERVDIVTGGNSAVYGSDALAGVVNFILKDSFQGVQLRAQGGISEHGDAGAYFISGVAGKNFADGRGNIALNVEYARQNSLYASQRSHYRRNDTFLTVDSDTATDRVNGNLNYDGNPDSVFFRDVRGATISSNGLVAFGSPTGACGRDVVGRAFTCNYLFQADGSLVPQTGTRVGLSGGTAAVSTVTPAGSFIGGNNETRREGQLVQLQPQLDRYTANLIGHFDVSDAFKPFVEAKYSRTESVGQGTSGPAFFTGSTIDALYERPRLDNPYLSAAARGTIATQLLASANAGFNPTTGAAFTNTLNDDGSVLRTAAQNQANTIAAINGGSQRFILRKNLVDLGVRTEAAKRETYRIVGGVRGDIASDIRYEVSANYGEFREQTKVLGNVNVQRLSLALDSTRNAAGQIVCAAQAAPARANGTGEDLAGNAAILAADIAACQPLNPFGSNVSEAARNYILQNTVSRGKITQFDATGFISGTTDSFFRLPGGGIGFSVGAEYRRETNFFRADPLVEQGYTFYNALTPFTPPSFEVKEAFGEIELPLLRDLPMIKELTISGAGRVSDYKGSAGTVYTYSLSGTYAPIRDIRFRANMSRAVRAPNLSELYSPQGQNFAPGFSDPCSAINIANGTQYRAANCAAAGVPASYDYRYAQSLEILSGGNPELAAETSKSYTYGVQIQPSFVPGLSLSVDYFNIKVNNVITAPTAQGIVNSCYDSPTTTNQFCSLFTRVAAGGTGPNGEEAYRIVEGNLQQTLLNYAKLQVRGIDADLAYTHKFGDTRLTSHLVYSHQFQNDSFTDPQQPGFADTFLGEVGTPRDEVNWNIGADFGVPFINLELHYIAKQAVGAIENHETFQGRAPQNLDDYDIPFYPAVFYINTRFGVNITPGSNFYLGVDNLTDQLPPLGATGTASGSAIFENVGRRFYAGITAKF